MTQLVINKRGGTQPLPGKYLEVVAEGVERPEQLAALQQEGCRSVQGFLLARPQPAEELLPMLLGNRPLTAAA